VVLKAMLAGGIESNVEGIFETLEMQECKMVRAIF
jgi:hypothetical protein